MRVILIGASGTIGTKIHESISKRHEVISAGRNSGEVNVDITSAESIRKMYENTSNVDAVICAAGPARMAPLAALTEDDVYVGIRGKLMGQVNLVLIGQKHLNAGGSLTLTTGILSDDPIVGSAPLALVNGAVNSFVIAAAQELPNGIRINAVCPTVVEDSAEEYGDYFIGFDPAPMGRVVNAYLRSLEGKITGRVIRIY